MLKIEIDVNLLLSNGNSWTTLSLTVFTTFLPFSSTSSLRGISSVKDAAGGAWFCGVPQVEATYSRNSTGIVSSREDRAAEYGPGARGADEDERDGDDSLGHSSTIVQAKEKSECGDPQTQPRINTDLNKNLSPDLFCLIRGFETSLTNSACSFWWMLYEPVAGLAEAVRPM